MSNQSTIATPAPAEPLSLAQQPLYEEDSPMEEVRVIPDFLPPPEELAFYREEMGG